MSLLYEIITNANSITTASGTYKGTVVLIVFWIILEVYVLNIGIPWKVAGSRLRITELSSQVRLFLIGLIAFLWIPFAFNKHSHHVLLNENVFDKSDTTNLKIAILPFKPDIDCIELDIDYKGQLLERLENKRQNEDLLIKVLSLSGDSTHCPSTNDQARQIGLDINADMVIWGSYEEDTKGIKALRVRYSVISNFSIDVGLRNSDSEMQLAYSLSQLRDGYLQTDIDYVIYWVQGMNSYKKGFHKEAIKYFNKIINNYPDKIYTLETYLILGEIYYEMLRGDESLKYYTYALEILKQEFDTLSPRLASTYANIGASHRLRGDYDRAIETLNEALRIQLKSGERFSLDRAHMYFILGTIYNAKLDYHNAQTNLDSALIIQTRILQPSDPQLARTFMGMGGASMQKGDYNKAKAYLNKALSIQLTVLPANHPYLARIYLNLGGCYNNTGQYDTALYYFHQSLSIQITAVDSLNPDLGTTYYNLGASYYYKGEMDTSIIYTTKALDIFTHRRGSSHPDLIYSLINLGQAYVTKGDYNKGIEYFDKALIIQLSLLDSLHIDLIALYINIADAYFSKSDNNKALDHLKKAERILINSESSTDSVYIYGLYKAYYKLSCAQINHRLGNFRIAAKEIDEAILIFPKYYPKDHIDYIKAIELRSNIHLNQK